MLEMYGTLGPACSSADLLEQMLSMGMTGVRLNLSHVTLAQAADQVEALHTAARRLGVKPKLLIDMQGPELRIGPMSHDVHMIEGKNILLHQPGGGFPFLPLHGGQPGAVGAALPQRGGVLIFVRHGA